MIVYGREAFAAGTPLLQALGNIALVTGHAGRANNGMLSIGREANSRGALDMGVRPDRGPGYTNLTRNGMSAGQMLDAAAAGKLQALYIAGLDPATAVPAARAALERVGLLVVQDMFLTPTAQLADYVLPAAAFAERDGTFTNAERRVQRFRAARNSMGESRADWQIFASLGSHLAGMVSAPAELAAAGAQGRVVSSKRRQAVPSVGDVRPWRYRSADDVNAEITASVAIYRDAGYRRLSNAGGVWGRQATADPVYYDGTSYTNTEGFGVQWPSLAEQPNVVFDLVFSQPRAPRQPDNQMLLVVASRLYDGGTGMEGAEGLGFWVAQPYAGLALEDAQRLGVSSGDRLRLTSSAGSLELDARVERNVAAGTLLVPELAALPLGQVKTGVLTPVRVEKVEG